MRDRLSIQRVGVGGRVHISQPPVCNAGRNSRGRTSGWRMADQ